MAELTPTYLETDFLTLVQKFKTELGKSDVFKDYDFEGSNISILIELLAYMGELSTFLQNKIATNTYLETADVYEASNRLARQAGYEPKGTRSARCTFQVAVSGTQAGDVLRVLPWKQLNSGRQDPTEGNEILFATTASTQVTASGNITTIDVPVRQGEIITLTGYTGDDLIDNELILPAEYAYDDSLEDDIPSVRVLVNNTEWERLSDFYLDLVPGASDNVYQLIYDRYRRNKIIFNSSRNVPADTDDITVTVLDSLGTDGSIGADVSETWTIVSDELIELTRGISTSYINNDVITISLSAASLGASAPETISEIKFNSQSALRSQFRDVNSTAYNSFLSARSDVVKATAYGEQDLVPSGGGDPQEYNIVHLSVIPEDFNNNTIQTSAGSFTTDWGETGSILVPTKYATAWKNEILLYLRSRKMIGTYEQLELPDLVYFSLEIGIKKKRIYNFSDISADVLNKLIYYFRSSNQEFNDIIDFNEITEYLLDASEVSSSDNFDYIKGIRNLNIRDINCSKTIYEYNANENNSNLYPRWTVAPYTNRDNMLRSIQLGLKQFPILSSSTVKIFEEV